MVGVTDIKEIIKKNKEKLGENRKSSNEFEMQALSNHLITD